MQEELPSPRSLLIMKLLVFHLLLLSSCARMSLGKCPAGVLVMYRMVLHTEWSREKFPKQYPEWRPPAQWSVVIGRTHNSSGILWRLGETASDSVKMFVETGKAEMLIREGTQQKRGILSEFFAPPVTQGVGKTETKFFVDTPHSKVSLMCRIIPSPDWFVGVDSLDLCRGSKWVDSLTFDLQPIDGGTDNGYTFTSPKWPTDPRSSIATLQTDSPDHPASSFYYPEMDKLPRIAHVTFLKLKEFFLTKQILRDVKGESLVVEDTTAHSTSASVLSSSANEVKNYPLQKNQRKKDERRRKRRPKVLRTMLPAAEKSRHQYSSRKQENRVKSCRVTDWTEWGPCSNSCGFGEQLRKRKVTHFPSDGGQPCPPLEESKWCRSTETCRNQTLSFFRWQ